MCALVFTHNPMRSVKQRITTGTLGLAITAIILAVTTIVDVIITNVTGDYYYGYYFYYFFYGFGSVIVLGIISFFAYIALLGSYVILGASFLKIGDMTLKDAEKARLAGIFLIIGACFEGIGLITRFFEFERVFGVGNYILIIATGFYFTGFFFIVKVYNSMYNEKLISKKMTPVVLFAPVFYFFKTLTTIIIFATESIDYLTYLNIDSGLSLISYTILAVGIFLLYYSTNNIDDGEAYKFFKPEGQPIYQPYVQQPYQVPQQQVAYSSQKQNQVQFCPNCGNKINVKDAFCSTCGEKIER